MDNKYSELALTAGWRTASVFINLKKNIYFIDGKVNVCPLLKFETHSFFIPRIQLAY